MKKILFIATVVALSLGTVSYVFATPTPAPDYEQCTHFNNVNASISSVQNGEIYAIITNYNDNPVMVDWEIKAYDVRGNYVTIGSGQVKVPAGQTRNGYRIPVSGYSGWGIRIHNCR